MSRKFGALAFAYLQALPDNHIMQIGQQIKKKRLALGATLEQIAFEAGIDASNLSRIERNVQQPSSALVKKIADALQTTVGQLYNEKDSVPGVREELPPTYDRHTQTLLRQFWKLTPDNQTLVLEFVRMLGRVQAKE
jgi:transcriptional regulator with XRE-family HTH domain